MYLWSYTLVGSKNRLFWFNHSELAVFVFNVSEDIVWKLSNTKQEQAEQRISDELFYLVSRDLAHAHFALSGNVYIMRAYDLSQF